MTVLLSRKEINQQIYQIALPNIFSNITIPLLGIVDTVLMGYRSTDATVLIGAIGLGGVIFNAIYWNLGFIRIATTGITAQAYGENNPDKQSITLFRALSLGLILAFIILLLKPFIQSYGFPLLTTPENQKAISYAIDYFSIRIWAVPAVMLLYGFRGWFYGMQNAIYPFILTTVVNLVNIGASIYCVEVLDMNANGVALGTVIAQYTCLIVAVSLMIYKYSWVFRQVKNQVGKLTKGLSEFFRVSVYVLGRNIMLFAVFATFTYYSSTVDEEYFAVNQMLLELFYLMSFAVDGFAYASEALVGKFFGSKQSQNLLLSVKWTMIWGVSFGVLYAILFQLFGEQFLSFFSPDKLLIESGKPYLKWLSIISIVGAIAFIWDGVYIGATLVFSMFFFMAISTISFFVVLTSLKADFPKQSVWAALTVYMGVRGVLQALYFQKVKRKFEQ